MPEAPLVRSRLTYDDLCRLPSDGHRWELVEGEPYMTPSPNRRHQEILKRLLRAFEDAAGEEAAVYFAPLDVVFSQTTALQPDLIVVLAENRGALQDVIRGTPDLVVEVLSPSTAEMDRTLKRETYARHGVREYWIVDPDAEGVEIHRLDAGASAFRLAARLRETGRAGSPLLPGLAIELRRLFA